MSDKERRIIKKAHNPFGQITRASYGGTRAFIILGLGDPSHYRPTWVTALFE